jgi:hypothetical protein
VALGWEEGGEKRISIPLSHIGSEIRISALPFSRRGHSNPFRGAGVVNAGLAQSVVDANGLGDLAG